MKTLNFKWLLLSIILSLACTTNAWGAVPADTYYGFSTTKAANETVSPTSGVSGNIITCGSSGSVASQSATIAGTTYSYGLKLGNSVAKGATIGVSASVSNPAHIIVFCSGSGKDFYLQYGGETIDTRYVYGVPTVVELVTTNSGTHTIYTSGDVYCYYIQVLYEGNDNIFTDAHDEEELSLPATLTAASEELCFFRPCEVRITNGKFQFSGGASGMRKAVSFKSHVSGTLTVEIKNLSYSKRYAYIYGVKDYKTLNDAALATTAQLSTNGTATLEIDVTKGTYYAITASGADVQITSITLTPSGNTLQYNANGGTGTMSNTTGSGSITLSTNTYTKSGCSFAGWATSQADANAGTVAYADGASYTLSADATLYAVWKLNTPSISCTNNVVTITVPGSSTVYYTTDGSTTPTSSSTAYDPSNKPTIVATTTFKAIAILANHVSSAVATQECVYTTPTYTITNGSPSNGIIAITDGSSAITSAEENDKVYIEATPNTGYSFSSWDVYKTSASGTKVTPAASLASTYFTMPDYAVTVNASFSAINYDVTYSAPTNGNYTISVAGGSATSASKTATIGQTITLAATPSSGYVLSSWTVSKESGGTVTVSNNQFTMPADNVTITATFARVYTVTYSAGASATCKSSDTQASSGANITLATPTWSSHTFLGWYVGDTKIGDAGDDYEPTADITVYGAWKEDCAGGGGDPVSLKLFDGSTDDAFAASPISNSGVSVSYTSPDAPSTQDVSGKTNNVGNSKDYSTGFQYSASQVKSEVNRNYLSFTVPSGYTATFTYAFAASGNDRVIRLGSSFVLDNVSSGYLATLVTFPSSNGSKIIEGGTYSSSLAAGTYYITGTGGGWQVVELIFTLTPTGGGGGECYYVTYNGNGADGGLTCDPTAYAANDDPVVLDNGDGGSAYTKAGYTFTGWNTLANGTGTPYAAGGTITDISDNITLYAQWDEACSSTPAAPSGLTNGATTDVSQVVTWTANGENTWEVYYNTSSSTPGVDQTPTATVNSATYTFTGLTASTTYYWWARSKCDDSYKSAWVAGTSFTTAAATYTLTATAITNMTGTFTGSTTITNSPVSSVTAGTTIATSDNTFTVGGSTTVAAPETIAGTLEVDDGGTPYNAPCTWRFSKWNNIVTPVAGDESDIEAEYVPTFAINYTLDGGTINESYPTYYIYTGDEEDVVTLPTDVTKANYTFDHWVDASSITRSKITCDYWVDFNLTAVWTPNQYSVTHTLSNVTTSSGATGANAATYGSDYTAEFAAASSAYELPNSVTVTAGGSDITASCTYTKGTGTVVIPGASITGNIVITVTGVYAANFKMVANSSATSDATLDLNEYISQGSKNCTTLTGGTAQYQGNDGKTMKVYASNGSGTSQYYGWYFNNSGDKIVVTMTGHILQVGSVISVEGYGASGNGITANTSTSLLNGTGSQQQWSASHTVVAGDTHLVGKNVITFDRYNSCRIFSITISNCQSGTMCVTPVLPSLTTPNQGCTTSDFAEWDASVTNSAAISAASGSQAVSYSWKNGSSVEVATTAAYTPTAAGTYTVTATVHSDASGYIDATATSSTLTASLYTATSISTQPTTSVDAIEDENFTLGSTLAATGQGTLNYQWFSYSNSAGTADETSVRAASTTKTYTTSQASAGTYYYRVKIIGDCGTVASNVITVTVTEAPCFKFSCESQSSKISAISSESEITTSLWEDGKATLTGGTMTNGSSSLNVNKTYGLVMESDKEVTVTLGGDYTLAVGSVITLKAGVSDASGSQTSGLVVSGNTCSPASYTSSTAGADFTQTYTVTALDGLAGTKSFTIAMKSDLTKTYLNGITVTGCVECDAITPSLSYDKTTLWVNDGDIATPTLDKDESTGSVTYSSSNTDIATVNESTGVVTAAAAGNVTITASIAADGTHCANTATCNLTIKNAACGEIVIAGVTLSAKNAGTPEGTLIASSDGYVVSTQKWETPDGGCGTGGKLGAEGYYICLTLKSGESFKNGDKVILDIAKVSDVGDNKLHIYAGTSSAGTQLGENASPVCGENEIILSGISSSTPSITLYRTSGDDKQNPYVVSMKVKRFICTDCLGFFDGTDNGSWNTTGNWIGSTGVSASVPTASDRVHIYKPVTVSGATAALASEVILYTNTPTNTGKLTIASDGVLKVAGTIQAYNDATSTKATTVNDLIIDCDKDHQGALIFENPSGDKQAQGTVNFYTRSYRDGTSNKLQWQYVGYPFASGTDEDYDGYYINKYDESGGRWIVMRNQGVRTINAWEGLAISGDGEGGAQLQGTFAPTTNTNVSLTYGNAKGENLVGNSWTAPIQLAEMDASDFGSATATVYIFNTGRYKTNGDEGSSTESGTTEHTVGQWMTIPISSAKSGVWAGMKVIPAFQAFEVITPSATTLSLDYSKVVRRATNTMNAELHAPARRGIKAAEVDGYRIRVADSLTQTDMYLFEDMSFTTAFDNGWEGYYMPCDGRSAQLYAQTALGKMAVAALPDLEGTLLGFKPGKSSEYTFSFGTNAGFYYLNDIKTQTSTLMQEGYEYTFTWEDGDDINRFMISATPFAKTTPTGVEDGSLQKVDGVQKVLYKDHMYIIRGGRVFDATGGLVK